MRTTITLDDDVTEKLNAEMRWRKTTNFKKTLNDVLRRGLLVRRQLGSVEPFKVRTRSLGGAVRPDLNFDNVGALLEQVEGSGHQ